MTHVQRDNHRLELRKGAQGTISLYPVDEAGKPLTVDSAEYEVRAPDGTVLQVRSAASVTPVGEAGSEYSRIDCAVAAISTVDHDYSVAVWHTTSGTERFAFEVFNVVAYPLGPTTTLDDLKLVHDDAQDKVAGVANQRGMTIEDAVSYFASEARNKLNGWLNEAVEKSAQQHPAYDRGKSLLAQTCYFRGHAVLDRARLRSVERYLAGESLFDYLTTGSGPETDDNAAIASRLGMKARREFDRMGALSFDSDADLVVDEYVHKSPGTIRMRRVQA